MNVLLIEDQTLDHAMIHQALERAVGQIAVDWRQNGNGLLDRLKTNHYDCVLIDHVLPDANGLDLIREISTKLGDSAPPVIMVTGSGDERLAAAAIKAGADDYLPKSGFPWPDLGDVLKHAIESRQRRRRSAAQRRQIEKMAMFDCLTGVCNRCSFDEDLERARAIAERAGTSFTLFIIDLDEFKAINDSHGHLVGDAVLSTIGARLRHTLRGTDKGFRIGGDEFAVIAETCESAPAAIQAGRRLYSELTRPIRHDGLTISTGCSIGAVVYTAPGIGTRDLFHQADTAMYQAKRSGAGIVIMETHTGVMQPFPFEQRPTEPAAH